MRRNIGRIFEEFHSCADSGISEDVQAFLEADDMIKTFHVEADEGNKIFVNVTLKDFSYLAARNIFLGLTEYTRRSCFNIYAGEEAEERMRYQYLTGTPGKDGIKMEVVIG